MTYKYLPLHAPMAMLIDRFQYISLAVSDTVCYECGGGDGRGLEEGMDMVGRPEGRTGEKKGRGGRDGRAEGHGWRREISLKHQFLSVHK